MTSTSQNSKVITALTSGPNGPSAFVAPRLLIWGLAEALAKHVAIQFQHQGQLLEETRRDLEAAKRELAEVKCEREAYKEAYRSAESDRRDLEETVKREKQALKDEIRELMERGAYGREEGSNPKNKA